MSEVFRVVLGVISRVVSRVVFRVKITQKNVVKITSIILSRRLIFKHNVLCLNLPSFQNLAGFSERFYLDLPHPP